MSTTTEQAVERVRQMSEHLARESKENLLAVLAAYDARGKEIEALKKSEEHSASLLDYAGHGLDSACDQRDALRKWAESADHRRPCLGWRSGVRHCTCGLTAALDAGK